MSTDFAIPKLNMFQQPIQQTGAVGPRGAEGTKGPSLFGAQKTGAAGAYTPNYAQHDYNIPQYEGGMNVPGGKAGLKLDFAS